MRIKWIQSIESFVVIEPKNYYAEFDRKGNNSTISKTEDVNTKNKKI